MMIEINNLAKIVVDKKFFTGVAKKVLKGENRLTENLSIAFVGPEEIQALNKAYRKKDAPTDVLSFERVSDFKEECAQIVICPQYVSWHTQDSRLSLKKELAKAMIHGILHVLGYDHEVSKDQEEKMRQKQEYYLSHI